MAELSERLQQALGSTYQIVRELPGGGMSRVFLATEVALQRSVVVKVLPPEMSAAVQAERFAREIQVAASLQHPHIVPLLTAGSHGDLAWYVMPFIEGESLAAKLAREGALPVNEAVRILKDVIDALAYSHSRGVVHRDIKPDNVMISGRHALVTDFGVAKAVSASSGGKGALTTGGVALGTPTYMAPEQAAADPHIDHRADLYAVGVVAYELLTGRTPFLAMTPQAMLAAHVTAHPDPITHHRPTLPPMLAAAVMRCLEKIPADRWQTSSELAAVMEAASTPSSGMTPVPTGPLMAFGSGAEGALRRANPYRVAGLFALATVIVVPIIFGATRVFGLPDWVWVGSAGLMALGFPIVMYTGRVERKRARATIAGTPTSGAAKPHHQWFTWRRAIMGGVFAIGALLFAAVGYATARALGIGPAGTLLSSGAVAADDRFVLADFKNRTADTSLGTSVTEALRVDLSQSRVVKMLSDREVAGALTRMTLKSGTGLTDSLALQLAQREGAKAVIVGDISSLGTGYVLAASVVDASTGEAKVSVRATAADAGKLLTALNDLSAQLRERIGESLKTIRTSDPLEQVTTGSLDALQHFSAGSRIFTAGDFDGARKEIEAAIRIDTNFAMAYRKLAAILTNQNAPASEISAASARAFQLRDRLTPVERALTEATYYRNVEPDPEKVVTAYQAVLAVDPYNITAANNIAMTLNRLERSAEAEPIIRPVLERTPTRTLFTNFGSSLVLQGKFVEAESVAQAVRRVLPGQTVAAAGIEADIFSAKREFRQGDSLARAQLPTGMTRGDYENLEFYRVNMATALGRHRTALGISDSLAEAHLASGDTADALSIFMIRPWVQLFDHGDTAEVRHAIAELLRRYPLERQKVEDRPFVPFAYMYAFLGDADALHRLRTSTEAAIPVGQRQPGAGDQWDALEAWSRKDYGAASAAFARYHASARCSHCNLYYESMVWEQAGNHDSALALLERATTSLPMRDTDDDAANFAPAQYHLGELYEAKGEKVKAAAAYQNFIDLWRDADQDLQPRVTEAKRRLAALGTDTPQH